MAKWAEGKKKIIGPGEYGRAYQYSTVQHYFTVVDGAYQALCGARYDSVVRGNGKKRKCSRCETKWEGHGLDGVEIINMPAKAIAGFCEKGDCSRA